jgi:SpoVK/Ycf46/Vps4 family AAA+-type ATPase
MNVDDRILPPAKKQRTVDLSYVSLSPGVVFLPNDFESRYDDSSCREDSVVESPIKTSTYHLKESRHSCDDDDMQLEDENEKPKSQVNKLSGLMQTTVMKSRRESLDDMSNSSRVELTEFKSIDTRFSDIIGHGDVKIRMDELLLPLALPATLMGSVLRGVRALPASLLLHGPPGCGKTQLARAFAGEAQAAFRSIGPSDILSKYVGESEASIRTLFREAAEAARRTHGRCAVLFFDEIDALGYSRGDETGKSQDGDGSRRILAELLIQLSNLSTSQQQCQPNLDTRDDDTKDAGEESEAEDDSARVMVIAATNRLADCDPALIRRFAIQVYVGVPVTRDRRKILRKFLSDFQHSLTKAEIQELSEATDGWSGSDLESLAREASMAPIRECLKVAAGVRRKAREMEQHGGVESAQETCKARDAFQVAKDVLMKEFQTLRPVTSLDFEEAMEFLLGNNTQQPQHRSMYDSSSDSDDDL